MIPSSQEHDPQVRPRLRPFDGETQHTTNDKGLGELDRGEQDTYGPIEDSWSGYAQKCDLPLSDTMK